MPLPVAALSLDGRHNVRDLFYSLTESFRGDVLKERLALIAQDASGDITDPQLLRFVTPDAQDGPLPNLSDPNSQKRLESALGNAELIVIDNLSCLAIGTERENDSESWNPVSAWALRMRKEGRAVLFIHHSNKTGGQRGTSKREDILDTVINLRHPPDYKPSQGACFEVHFEKSRGLKGEAVVPFEAALTDTDGCHRWVTRDLEATTFERVVELSSLEMTPNEIAEELNVHKSTISRHLKAAKSQGLLRG